MKREIKVYLVIGCFAVMFLSGFCFGWLMNEDKTLGESEMEILPLLNPCVLKGDKEYLILFDNNYRICFVVDNDTLKIDGFLLDDDGDGWFEPIILYGKPLKNY